MTMIAALSATMSSAPAPARRPAVLAEEPATYLATPPALAEQELVALWLLGRVPAPALPWPLLRPGRAGQGPGPDVREATVVLPSGVTRTGPVEVHLRASDFARHGHDRDPAYGGLIAHLVWEDDRPLASAATPLPGGGAVTPLPGGGAAPTVIVGPALGGDPARLRALVHRGPAGGEPCSAVAAVLGPAAATARVRREGQRRLAERTWRAAALVAERGWDGAWSELLEAALRGSAGRCRESDGRRAALAVRLTLALGADLVAGLRRLADCPAPRHVIAALRADGALGAGRAAEVGWNAVLPLLAALVAAYEDVALARRVAALVAAWPAPRPYGRTRALAALLGPPAAGAGALYAQGLLHLQDLWCERGGCGACPLSRLEAERGR